MAQLVPARSTSGKRCAFFLLPVCAALESISPPSYLDNRAHSNQRAGLPERQIGRKNEFKRTTYRYARECPCALEIPGAQQSGGDRTNSAIEKCIAARAVFFDGRSVENRDARGIVAAHAAGAFGKDGKRREVRGAGGAHQAKLCAGKPFGDRAAHRAVRGQGFGARALGELGAFPRGAGSACQTLNFRWRGFGPWPWRL